MVLFTNGPFRGELVVTVDDITKRILGSTTKSLSERPFQVKNKRRNWVLLVSYNIIVNKIKLSINGKEFSQLPRVPKAPKRMSYVLRTNFTNFWKASSHIKKTEYEFLVDNRKQSLTIRYNQKTKSLQINEQEFSDISLSGNFFPYLLRQENQSLNFLIDTDFENEMFSVVVNDVPYEDIPFVSSAQKTLISNE